MRLFYNTVQAAMLFHASILAAASEPAPGIRWMQVDWAPSWIMDGELKGLGYGDQIESVLFDNLPGYQHEQVTITFSRMIDMLGKDPAACSSTGFYRWPNTAGTAPRDDIVWSAPVLMFEWHGLVVHQSQLAAFPAQRPLPFASFIDTSNKILLLQDGRDLGPTLNHLVARHEHTGRVLRRGGGYSSTTGIYNMVAKGRADYTIDYPFMLRYANKTNPELNMVFIPLQEHVRDYGFGAVVCTKSELTERLIADINRQIDTLRSTKLRQINAQWFEPAENAAQFWQDWESKLVPLKQ